MMWAVYDQMALVYTVCLWVARKRSLEDQRTGTLTLTIYTIYCLTIGVPFGFCFKVTTLDGDFPKHEHLSPLYVQSVFLLIIVCGCAGRQHHFSWTYVLWVLCAFAHALAWMVALYSDVICKHYFCSSTDRQCSDYFYFWSVGLLAVCVELFVAAIFLVAIAFHKGKVHEYI